MDISYYGPLLRFYYTRQPRLVRNSGEGTEELHDLSCLDTKKPPAITVVEVIVLAGFLKALAI